MPAEIVGDDEDLVKSVLAGHKKSGHQWDDYAGKLDSATRETLKNILKECRKNGFIAPIAVGDRLVWYQVTSRKRGDECSMCPNQIDKGECLGKEDNKKNFHPCWEVRNDAGR